MAKLPVILGNLDVTIDNVAPDLTSKPSKFPPCTQYEKMKSAPAQTRWVTLSADGLFGFSHPLPPASVCRLCYLILHSCEAVWCEREDQHLLWSGGVCAMHSQMFSAFHNLQQSPLRLPEALEVRQPEVFCKGTVTLKYCNMISRPFSLMWWLTGSISSLCLTTGQKHSCLHRI